MKKPITLVLAILCAAPTVGDIGSCGKTAVDLDEKAFGVQRKKLDCGRCKECHIGTKRCDAACDPDVPSDVSFGTTCRPLVRDGAVCLDALAAAGCTDYAKYMSDDERLIPAECDFCKGDVE